jgi:hypothetical protein
MRRVLLISLSMVMVLAGWAAVRADDGFYVISGLRGQYAPVAKTGQTISHGARDDGALQKGVTWPSPRFNDNNNGTVSDNLTGLIWTKNANIFNNMKTWNTALSLANNLKSGDYGLTDGSQAGDWRLPNCRELLSLVDDGNSDPAFPGGHPFTNLITTNRYWTSTTRADHTSDAWAVDFNRGYLTSHLNATYFYVWCVRGGQ